MDKFSFDQYGVSFKYPKINPFVFEMIRCYDDGINSNKNKIYNKINNGEVVN